MQCALRQMLATFSTESMVQQGAMHVIDCLQPDCLMHVIIQSIVWKTQSRLLCQPILMKWAPYANCTHKSSPDCISATHQAANRHNCDKWQFSQCMIRILESKRPDEHHRLSLLRMSERAFHWKAVRSMFDRSITQSSIVSSLAFATNQSAVTINPSMILHNLVGSNWANRITRSTNSRWKSGDYTILRSIEEFLIAICQSLWSQFTIIYRLNDLCSCLCRVDLFLRKPGFSNNAFFIWILNVFVL